MLNLTDVALNYKAAVDHRTWLGRAVRAPLRAIPADTVIPVIYGPIAGQRWIVGSGIHRLWLGFYEPQKAKHITSAVQPGMVCFDIGANVGYYSLLFSKYTTPQGRVISFEPLPQNAAFLCRHIAINRCTNILVKEIAVSDRDATEPFHAEETRSKGHLSHFGQLVVQTRTLDSLLSTGEIPMPDLVKIDVEGDELRVLTGARTILSSSRPLIFLATHSRELNLSCSRYLTALGYSLTSLDHVPITESDELRASKPRERK